MDQYEIKPPMEEILAEETGRSYRDLIVWKKGIALVEEIYAQTQGFPRSEVYGLTNQIRRAAVSIPSNIAEGQARKNQKEFDQFLHIALGSLAELDTQIVIASKLGYLQKDAVVHLENHIFDLRKMLFGLIQSLYRT